MLTQPIIDNGDDFETLSQGGNEEIRHSFGFSVRVTDLASGSLKLLLRFFQQAQYHGEIAACVFPQCVEFGLGAEKVRFDKRFPVDQRPSVIDGNRAKGEPDAKA